MGAFPVWTSVLIMAWGVVFGSAWPRRRYFSWLVRTTGTSVVGATLLTVAVHLAGGLLFGLTASLINDLAVRDFPTWLVALLFVLVGMVYAPLVCMAIPSRNFPPFEDIRQSLEEAGATLGQERAVAWIGGLLAFPGLTAIVMGAAILLER